MVFWRGVFRAVSMQSGNSITKDRDKLKWVKCLIIIIINGGILSPDIFPPLSSQTKTHHGGNLSWWEYAGRPFYETYYISSRRNQMASAWYSMFYFPRFCIVSRTMNVNIWRIASNIGCITFEVITPWISWIQQRSTKKYNVCALRVNQFLFTCTVGMGWLWTAGKRKIAQIAWKKCHLLYNIQCIW